MAANLQLLKRRITTAKNISQITKAMEMIAASKIKKAQDTVTANKPYAERIEKMTTHLLANLEGKKFSHPYLKKKKGPKLSIVFSSDKGLCGSLNTNLLKHTYSYLDENKGAKVVVIGKKAEMYIAGKSYNLISSSDMGTSQPTYSRAVLLKDIIDEHYVNGECGGVDLIYSSFESFFLQEPQTSHILPLDRVDRAEESSTIPYLFEPSASEILTTLLPYYLEIKLYSALIESYTSEQAARMMAMQNAKNNANDIADYLTLSYNKLRQEKITNEILDLNNQ